MANKKHLELLHRGVGLWNDWREKEPSVRPDLSGAILAGMDLRSANLTTADLSEANLQADLSDADLSGADLRRATLLGATLHRAALSGADLSGANLQADLSDADLSGANLAGADLLEANLYKANLSGADLSGANLNGAKLNRSNLHGAKLNGADLKATMLLETDFTDADLTGCLIYGASAWDLKLERTRQLNLVITRSNEPEVTVDNIEVAQFVRLLLHNEKIRDVIDTVGRKGVLLLGRFTEGRIEVLNRLRDALRQRGYVPIVFNFDRPETKDFTETVRLLAGLAKFVIADLSSPKSVPYELSAIVSQTMIPFQPIIEAGETPFAMLRDLRTSYPDRVFEPIEYSSIDRLVETMEAEIIEPAEARFDELVTRRAETWKIRRV